MRVCNIVTNMDRRGRGSVDETVRRMVAPLWTYLMEQDGQQYEREVELRSNRFVVQFLREEMQEMRGEKRRLLTETDELQKRLKVQSEELDKVLKERDKLQERVDEMGRSMIGVVRERDHFRESLGRVHDDRKQLRSSVRTLKTSLNGSSDPDTRKELERLERYCMN